MKFVGKEGRLWLPNTDLSIKKAPRLSARGASHNAFYWALCHSCMFYGYFLAKGGVGMFEP